MPRARICKLNHHKVTHLLILSLLSIYNIASVIRIRKGGSNRTNSHKKYSIHVRIKNKHSIKLLKERKGSLKEKITLYNHATSIVIIELFRKSSVFQMLIHRYPGQKNEGKNSHKFCTNSLKQFYPRQIINNNSLANKYLDFIRVIELRQRQIGLINSDDSLKDFSSSNFLKYEFIESSQRRCN